MKKLNVLSRENKELFIEIYNEVSTNSRFEECANYMHHGDTSIKKHAITVTLLALNLSEKLNIKVNKRYLIRGALLHDYFLYDWHDMKLKDLHGFHHPTKALKEALKDFNLSRKEIDIIKHHMFPLTYECPRCKESLLVCIADKICAWGETIDGRLNFE